MAERRTIGQILMSFGRITDDDVEKALEYQRKNGGYFGQALMALGYVSPEELEWGLAAQFDLPYVFPEVEAIDLEAAALVSADWALTHLTLPIMRTADALTVIVDSPIKTEAVDQLQARTERRIELALAPASKIRELIQQVYGDERLTDDAPRSVATLGDVLGGALEAGAERFGISVRGAWAHGWYSDRGTMRRMALTGGWAEALEEIVTPSPRDQVGGATHRVWEAQLAWEGIASAVEVHYLANDGGVEYLFRPEKVQARLLERFPPPPPGVVSEVRLLAQSGSARFAVTGQPDTLVSAIFPYLPALLFQESWRSVHLAAAGSETPDDVFSLRLDPASPDAASTVDEVRGFHFDAATLSLPGNPKDWASSLIDVAATTFVRWEGLTDRSVAAGQGIRWELKIESPADGHVEWSLSPLRG
jgi:type IV pilus assembly protein PilB